MDKPRLLFVVTEDWYFLSHRLPMAHAARELGFEVHVATRVVNGGDAIRSHGFVLHEVPFERGQLSPLAALRTIRAIRRLHREIQPVISHHVALQASVLASLAALDRDIVCLNALTGFGYTFTSNTAKARALRPVLGGLLRLVLARPGNVALVQNPDDHATLRSLGIPAARIATISGSGVDLSRFAPSAEPVGPVTIGYAGRLLFDKGVHTLVAAHEQARVRRRDLRLELAGGPDPANPTSVPESELARWRTLPGVTLHGPLADVARFWSGVHIAVLPSRREGLPKSLIEAAACGRPLIATDVPGCREVVIHERTGLLVPVDDAPALARAIETLAADPALRASYGAAARELAEAKFGADSIAAQIGALYGSLAKDRSARYV